MIDEPMQLEMVVFTNEETLKSNAKTGRTVWFLPWQHFHAQSDPVVEVRQGGKIVAHYP